MAVVSVARIGGMGPDVLKDVGAHPVHAACELSHESAAAYCSVWRLPNGGSHANQLPMARIQRNVHRRSRSGPGQIAPVPATARVAGKTEGRYFLPLAFFSLAFFAFLSFFFFFLDLSFFGWSMVPVQFGEPQRHSQIFFSSFVCFSSRRMP